MNDERISNATKIKSELSREIYLQFVSEHRLFEVRISNESPDKAQTAARTVRFANIIGPSMNSTRAYNQDAASTTSSSRAKTFRLFSIFFPIKAKSERSPEERLRILREMCIN